MPKFLGCIAFLLVFYTGLGFGQTPSPQVVDVDEEKPTKPVLRFPWIDKIYRDGALLSRYICREIHPCDVILVRVDFIAIVVYDDKGQLELIVINGSKMWSEWIRPLHY